MRRNNPTAQPVPSIMLTKATLALGSVIISCGPILPPDPIDSGATGSGGQIDTDTDGYDSETSGGSSTFGEESTSEGATTGTDSSGSESSSGGECLFPTVTEPYQACERGCPTACSGEGSEVCAWYGDDYAQCTRTCTSHDQCAAPDQQPPFDVALCINGVCAIECSTTLECPNPEYYTCVDGACVPESL